MCEARLEDQEGYDEGRVWISVPAPTIWHATPDMCKYYSRTTGVDFSCHH